MVASQYRQAIGTFSNRRDAEQALYELRDAGFNMDHVSVVVHNAEQNDEIAGASVGRSTEEQVKGGAGAGAVAGTATGGILGLIGSLGVLAIPGVGPVAEVGIVLANTLLGSGIGAAGGGLVGALIGLGVPEDRAQYYDQRLQQGDYVILVQGTDSEVRTAEAVLNNRGIRDWGIFDAPQQGNVRGNRAGVGPR